MLNVGPLELLVVLAVALIVVGPERLPDLARSVGRALRQLRQMQDEVRDVVSLGVDDDIRETVNEVKKARGSIRRATDVRGAVRRTERSVRGEITSTPEPGTPAQHPQDPDEPPAEPPSKPPPPIDPPTQP